ncbi:formimidoylglutamate deiminase [Actinocatenispora sera]|uniref:Formimidoylglutamate deiminase n=1 Tax=Actinocatenispora sera TaxID=390989 RepID=A0A810LE12_9ACTN|nr:formimidoylglutamate deiminase [Actinocatenispora sera]BCJ32456.1 formimidoylglutamate deiminase [Actinocatenispora sera]
MSTYWCEHAWLGDPLRPAEPGVLIEESAGRVTAVSSTVDSAPAGSHRLPGLTVPGFANAHSHAFHRALRGRTQDGGGTFWTWRERMYQAAARLDPDSYLRLARAVYAEMALAGVTAVGEFHYLHHEPSGAGYANPNAMGEALIEAARQAGIRICLLDTLYLAGGLTDRGYQPLSPVQQRFADADVDAWQRRYEKIQLAPHATRGAAIHSVRAVPETALRGFADRVGDEPLHVHLSEQQAENEACRAFHGRTPAQLLAEHGLLGPRLTAVHATHPTDGDITALGTAGAGVCLCPSTERELADGIGPARALVDAGCPLSLGSDSHAVIDPLAEARAVEMHERLATERRGHFTAGELLAAATGTGHAALGRPDAGRLAPGAPADLVTVALDSVRTAGANDPLAAAVFAATATDVRSVVVNGRPVVEDGRHLIVDDVAGELSATIREVLA